MDNLPYLKNLGKIELHAHLNGSLCIKSIKELAEQLYGSNTRTEVIQTLCEQLVDFDDVCLDKCFLKFRFMHELTSTKRGLQLATELVIRDFARDNVVYLELRTTPKRTAEMSKQDYIVCVLETIVRSMKTEKIHVNLLPSIDRAQSVAEAMDTVNIALNLRNEYGGIITGVDFSGNPKVGKFEEFMPALEKARLNNLKLAIHCGEIDNPAEIDQMIKFGMDRCGHGTFLNEEQINELGRKNIPIECCLTSNVKCRTVESYDDHHFKRIFESKAAPLILCTDDAGVFNTTLSKEYAWAQQSFNLKNHDIINLLGNAMAYKFDENKSISDLRQDCYDTSYDSDIKTLLNPKYT